MASRHKIVTDTEASIATKSSQKVSGPCEFPAGLQALALYPNETAVISDPDEQTGFGGWSSLHGKPVDVTQSIATSMSHGTGVPTGGVTGGVTGPVTLTGMVTGTTLGTGTSAGALTGAVTGTGALTGMDTGTGALTGTLTGTGALTGT